MTASDVASEDGWVWPVSSAAVLLPATVPPVWQSPPLAVTVAGLQMKKLIVPDGYPSASSTAETIAWSLTEEPTSPVVNVVVVPVPRGVVTVVVSSGPTVTHSPWEASLDPVYVVPVG